MDICAAAATVCPVDPCRSTADHTYQNLVRGLTAGTVSVGVWDGCSPVHNIFLHCTSARQRHFVHFTPLALKTDPTCRGNRMPIMKLDVNVEEYKLVHNLASLVHITDGTLDCYYTVQAARVSHTPT